MKLLQISEPCPICGEGVASLQHEVYLGSVLFYRECNFCTSDYAGANESKANALPHDQKVLLQYELLNKE